MARTVSDVERWRRFWEDEQAGAALYRALASATPDPERREVFDTLAAYEEKHAAHWASLLDKAGRPVRASRRLPFRVRVLAAAARRFGVDAVLPLVLRLESKDAAKYDRTADARPGMARDERAHGRTVRALLSSVPMRDGVEKEPRHRSSAGGALRAAVFGANDGLVSNVSLVMGVAGGTSNSRVVLLAGVAGLLAGAFSMAAGEWISIRSQRELYEREIEVEREELREFPEEEAEELALIYRAKGVPAEHAERLARGLMENPEGALDTHVREELGLSPGDLGSPWVAAWSSFLAFGAGAVVPVIPYLLGAGSAALLASALASAVALFAVGAVVSFFTGRSSLVSGLRMVAIGTVAAAATFGIGRAIGVTVT